MELKDICLELDRVGKVKGSRAISDKLFEMVKDGSVSERQFSRLISWGLTSDLTVLAELPDRAPANRN